MAMIQIEPDTQQKLAILGAEAAEEVTDVPSAFPSKAIGFAARRILVRVCCYYTWGRLMIGSGHFRKGCLIMH